jgi:hypothetical protein
MSELDFNDFESVLKDVEKRYHEKGKKYFDSWKHKDYSELTYIFYKDFQDLVDEYKNERIYKKMIDVILMGIMVAARQKHGED